MIKFKAIPIDIVPDEIESFNNAVEIFNSCQNQFNLELSDQYNFSEVEPINWANIKASLSRTYSESRIISVISKRFSDNWFSHSEDKVSVISTSDWKKLFIPPGLHCYLLLEFTLCAYFHSSDISEMASKPDEETKGCLIDLCKNKLDTKWKLKVGYICSHHSAHFLKCGGSEEQLQGLQNLLDEVRRITLGKPQLCSENNSTAVAKYKFSLESIKKHPVVVAALILAFGIGIGWGVAYEVLIVPKKERINLLKEQIAEIKQENNNTLKSGKKVEQGH